MIYSTRRTMATIVMPIPRDRASAQRRSAWIGGIHVRFPGDPTTPELHPLQICRIRSQFLLPNLNNCQYSVVPFRTPMPLQSSKILLVQTPRANGRERCPSPITSVRAPAKVENMKQDYQFRTIWDVIGKIRGTSSPDEWVVAGNHRDAWVYGAVDPNSGTAATLERHWFGEPPTLAGRPKDDLIGSWDAEEED